MDNGYYVPRKAMVIVAHPDDVEFSCAGTVARWVKDGAEVAYVLCTSGEVGIADSGLTKEKAAQIREAEQKAAAAVAGVKEVVFLRKPDGMLENTLAFRCLEPFTSLLAPRQISTLIIQRVIHGLSCQLDCFRCKINMCVVLH